MSDNVSNNAEPITVSAQDGKPGQAIGTEGGYVVPAGCEPLPKVDGKVDWKAAGWMVREWDDEGNVLQVERHHKTYTGFVWLQAIDAEAAMKYLGSGRFLAAFNGNGSKVKQQEVGRNYLIHLAEEREKGKNTKNPLVTHGPDGRLTETYREILLQKIWASLAGIQLEKRASGPRIVEKIVEVKVVSLPSGETFQVDKTDDTAPEMQLFSAWADALMGEPFEMDPDDAMAKSKKLLDAGKFHEMLGLEK